MSTPRIQGLVRLANHVRTCLAGPLGPEEVAALQETVQASLERVRQICHERTTTPDSLPAPSRKAYHYLAALDWSQVPTSSTPTAAQSAPVPAIRFRGLQKRIEGFLGALASPELEEGESIFEQIRELSEHIERSITHEGIQAEQLTEPTRQARGWLALLARRGFYDQYLEAVATAEPIFRKAIDGHTQKALQPPVRIWFQPQEPPAKIRAVKDATLVQCRTAMIGFQSDELAILADVLVHRKRRSEALHEAILGEAYQDIDAELEALGGIVERTAGAHHDLMASFERVNQRYFHGAMQRPRLAWSQRLTCRKLGHYDFVHDTVMISATLDQPHVPVFVLDYLMYHELLHKQHEIRWHNGRAHSHTPIFREDERRFEGLDEAREMLNRLGSG